MTKLIGKRALLLCLLTAWAGTAWAQDPRDDVIWARDVEGAELTLDGVLDESAWAQAETLTLQWNESLGLPGSGQKIEGESTLAEPLDPNDGTLHLLRNGNVLWMGLEVNDASIGGGRGLQDGNWFFDGLIMTILDRSQRPDDPTETENHFANGTNAEFIYSWWNPADTTETGGPVAGIEPRGFGDYGVGFDDGNIERDPADVAVWDFATTVDGTANDDESGDDTGYTMEMMIDLGAMGYDFSAAGGDQVPFGFALQDADYRWPLDEEQAFVSRVWFQNQWANNFDEGAAFIYGSPDVTVNSGEVPAVTEPEFSVPNAGDLEAPTIDGVLDEEVWAASDPVFTLQYQASPDSLDEWLPGSLAPYHVSWFRPDFNGEDEPNPDVVDPSVGRIHLVTKDNILYVGLDVDDQAISGQSGEGGRDGLRLTIRTRDSLDTEGTLSSKQFDVWIDSTGAAALGLDALGLADTDTTAVQAAAGLRGASTVADPTDVDEGYQIEIALDLTQVLGYEDGLGDRRIWLAANFFDGDDFEDPGNSYATRTWLLGERAEGASLYGYLDMGVGTPIERDLAEVPESIKLMGNYPNPFNPSTRIRYALPEAGEVTLRVYDVLGRRVATLTPGIQGVGQNDFTFNAGALASGMYLYRVFVTSQTTGRVQASAVGRMTLVE